MKVYHITYSPGVGIACLHFWGCNLACRACLLKREIYDYHLKETKDRIFLGRSNSHRPEKFLSIKATTNLLGNLTVNEVIFMGAEPALDPELPHLAEALHRKHSCRNVLLTNGFNLFDLKHIDEVVFSLKARSNGLHRHYTGKTNKEALQNFIRLYQSGIRLRTESIFIPDYIGYPEIEKIAQFIAGAEKNIPYRIDAYIPIGDNPWRRPTLEEMEKAVSVARKHLLNVSCLTGNENLNYEVVRVF